MFCEEVHGHDKDLMARANGGPEIAQRAGVANQPFAAQTADMSDEIEIDARDLLCPLPVLRARKVLLRCAPGTRARVMTTDPVAIVDMPHFCREAGHDYLGMSEVDGVQIHLIRRGSDT